MNTPLPDHVYAVILAGGSGTRFWPKSRHATPKQLCKIGHGDATMIELTLSRLEGFVPPDRRIIVTHIDQLELTKSIVGDRCHLFIAEPEARNTAAALGLAAYELKKNHSSGKMPIMISLHADHMIADVRTFRHVIEQGVKVAENGYLTLLGIVPTYPETGYGYIKKGPALVDQPETWKVESFYEKPPQNIATEFIATNQYFWNAGLFIWKVDTFIEELEYHLPQTATVLSAALHDESASFVGMPIEKLSSFYEGLEKIAIDHAVLEKSKKVAVIRSDFGWQDVGSWGVLDQCFPTDKNKNLLFGDGYTLDCERTTIDSDGPYVAAIGLKDFVVVAAKNAVLVCPKSRAQDVKLVVEHLKQQHRSDLT
jgi:mannose-1-phosphate guanylyltransferase